MKLFIASVALLLVVHSSLAAPWYEKVQDFLGMEDEDESTPDFCGSYDCPSYTVEQSFDVSIMIINYVHVYVYSHYASLTLEAEHGLNSDLTRIHYSL